LEILEDRLGFVELDLLCRVDVPSQSDFLKLASSFFDNDGVDKHVCLLEPHDVVFGRQENVLVSENEVEEVLPWADIVDVLNGVFFLLFGNHLDVKSYLLIAPYI